jgi:hypothetical protein
MPEIGTSGLMSEDRKRSVATWPKPPRLSSILLLFAAVHGPWRNIDFTRLFSQLVPNRPISFQ